MEIFHRNHRNAEVRRKHFDFETMKAMTNSSCPPAPHRRITFPQNGTTIHFKILSKSRFYKRSKTCITTLEKKSRDLSTPPFSNVTCNKMGMSTDDIEMWNKFTRHNKHKQTVIQKITTENSKQSST